VNNVPGEEHFLLQPNFTAVGSVDAGVVWRQNRRVNRTRSHMHHAKRCRARTRRGTECHSPATKNGRCRMHGGASTGAPKGNKNALKHGRYTSGAMARRRANSLLIQMLAKPERLIECLLSGKADI
jgi:hypothetical protein